MSGPPYDFAEFERRIAAHTVRTRRRSRGLQAAAASILVACLGLLGWSMREGRGGPAGTAAGVGFVRSSSSMISPAGVLLGQADLQVAETMPFRVEGGMAFAAAALEDHIAQLDDALTIATVQGAPLNQLHALDAERARLVDSLVQVRAAERLLVVSR